MNIKLIGKDTDLSHLPKPYDWDTVIGGRPFFVVRILGYVHSIGGRYGENDLWAYPRDEEPSYENLIEFNCSAPVTWGFVFKPKNYAKSKWDETEAFSSTTIHIFRNDEVFCEVRNGVPMALTMIDMFKEHPISLDSIDYDKKVIGRKVWWRSEPAIVTRYCPRQACVILEPDGIDVFTIPAEFANEDPDYYCDGDVKVDILDKHIWWFRE